MNIKWKAVKVCQPHLIKYYPECLDNNYNYPELVKYLNSEHEFDVFIQKEETGEFWNADEFFFCNPDIKGFTTN